MRCWNNRSRSTLTVSYVAWCTLSQHGNSSWSYGMEPCDQSFFQGFFVLTVLHVNSPWFTGNITNIMSMQSDRVTSNGFSLSKYSIILFASSVPFCCLVVLQVLCWALFLEVSLSSCQHPLPCVIFKLHMHVSLITRSVDRYQLECRTAWYHCLRCCRNSGWWTGNHPSWAWRYI